VKSTTRDARAVILAPVVSEKSYALLEDGKYSFRVHPDAHKTQIRQAIETLFSVRVVDVKVIKVPPKPKRRGIHRGTRPGYKKAIVRVAEGQTIPVFEGVA
jgi:large subunit ribosomal protein L23